MDYEKIEVKESFELHAYLAEEIIETLSVKEGVIGELESIHYVEGDLEPRYVIFLLDYKTYAVMYESKFKRHFKTLVANGQQIYEGNCEVEK